MLLGSGRGSVGFSGARRACGKRIRPGRRYSLAAEAGRVVLRDRAGDRITACGPLGKAGAGVRIGGFGRYRGSLVARNAGGTLQVINALGVQGYVKGVVASEVPSSWPAQALRAQAVVARSYGLATARGGAFDHYADTAQPGLRGPRRGDEGDQQGRRRDREPGRHLSRQAGGHLLLLVLRRANRELGVRLLRRGRGSPTCGP